MRNLNLKQIKALFLNQNNLYHHLHQPHNQLRVVSHSITKVSWNHWIQFKNLKILKVNKIKHQRILSWLRRISFINNQVQMILPVRMKLKMNRYNHQRQVNHLLCNLVNNIHNYQKVFKHLQVKQLVNNIINKS